MIKTKITLINKLGLHARASMKLVNCAEKFHSEIILHHKNCQVNAKSIMSLMVIGAPYGTTLDVTVEGTDEKQALEAVEALFADRFGESE